MLILDNITCKKSEKIIFSNLSFSIAPATSLIIAGKNGCGKTSLLKIIAGISKAQEGRVLIGDEDVEDFRDEFNSDLQYIGHKNFLKQELSVLQNLEFFAKLEESEILVPSALNFFKLEEKAHKKVKTLSAGWQKRVMLAKLVCCPSTIWLLDEPTNNLDREGKNLLRGLIETRTKDHGGIVILTTHDEDLFNLGAKLDLEDFC